MQCNSNLRYLVSIVGILGILFAALSLFVFPVNAADTPTLYEYLNTGQDGNSDNISGANWGYMQFTSDNISHTVTEIDLYLKRVGTPGTVTVSLREASAGVPTGTDLVSTTFDGDVISTSYTKYPLPVSAISLKSAQQYAILVRAIAGDSTNYILWGKDDGGGLANAISGTSADGGLTFAADGDNDDFLFEIWGSSCLEVLSAKVFTGYKETDDWLIVIDVNNAYAPYYPDSDPQLYFQLQLISGSTIKGIANFKAWQRQPLSIYLNAATANALSWGSAYKLRIQALFDNNIYAEYVLVPADWTAGSLLYLDSHIRTLASTYETYYSTTYLTNIAGQTNRVLNEAGSIIFIRGISGIEVVRPSLFFTSYGMEKPATTSHTLLTPNTQTALGTDVYNRLGEIAAIFSVGSEQILGWLLMIIALGIGLACVGAGHGIAGLIIGLFFAGSAGFAFGGIPIMILGAIGFAFVVLIALWLAKLIFQQG
jgi:hypothetical protein